MSCDCIKNIKMKLEEKVKNSAKFKGKDFSIKATDEVLLIEDDGKVKVATYSIFRAESEYTTSTGKARVMKEDFNITHKYCPYCGKEF